MFGSVRPSFEEPNLDRAKGQDECKRKEQLEAV